MIGEGLEVKNRKKQESPLRAYRSSDKLYKEEDKFSPNKEELTEKSQNNFSIITFSATE